MQIIVSWYAQFYSLKVTSETEVLNLILSNARVYRDLIEALDYQKMMNNKIANINNIELHNWNNNIIVHPWPEKYSNYLIDIGLIENKSTNKYDCIVIEMNPFETTTHPCLFDWTKDNNQLRGQRNEIEIRVQLDYYPNVEDYVEFILDINQYDGKNNSSSDHSSKEPYFIFLDKMKTQLSL
ncbi:unnamed protein product [Rotaria sp. Silwood1]|nr:unnamed protein product [Rotaria sp. Silwood1]CAF3734668.1 unnamed protein product [Rotaria sp. Silwood1]CAF3793106.1 unnamed protein product [Rotaria sp. Silwood1]CAF4708979.1 unnamed protein product [Rotaria sp. Silwood1]CAF4729206.1 unnamed protein product [Rotaria sp. Silwood1]